ncbi:MAG TPA: dihydrofolate reductase family protein [Vicinamibacterales bacterium]|nr:dihydrofolate reductase family protein [Vicinamibacterales bacterium]
MTLEARARSSCHRVIRGEDGPNLVTQGSTELVHALLANDLVDAMSIFTVPVVLGRGKKLFADGDQGCRQSACVPQRS